MKTIYVYIVKCLDGSYYTGVTNDLERRLREHNEGNDKDAYTYQRRPIDLQFYEIFNSPEQAIKFEKKLKGWTKVKKEALISQNWEKLKELSVCKNGSHYDKYNNPSTTLRMTLNECKILNR